MSSIAQLLKKILLYESKTGLHNVIFHLTLLWQINLFFYISTSYLQKHPLLQARASERGSSSSSSLFHLKNLKHECFYND